MPGSSYGTPDITKLPVITCWPKDGGPFVTLTNHSYKRSQYRIPQCRHVPDAGVWTRHLPACTGINIKYPRNILLNIKN